MDGEAIQAITELAQQAAEPVEIDGQHFVPCGMQQIVEQVFQPDALQVHSLTGLIGYIDANRDGLKLESLIAHVRSPTCVDLIGPIEPIRKQRSTHLVANAEPKDVCVGWQLPDEFTIMVTTGCVPSNGDDLDVLVRLVGNVRREQSVELKDDGMSQSVEQRAGVAMVERADVPNPLILAPYRSFREVDQVESPFLIRFREGDTYGETPDRVVCQLFECDGGAWQNEARERVANYLRGALPGGVVVIA